MAKMDKPRMDEPRTDEARQGAGADITDNRNADMAPKGSDALPSRKKGGSDAEPEIVGAERAQDGTAPDGEAGQDTGTSDGGSPRRRP